MIKERKNQNGANRAYKDLKIMPHLYLANPTKSISLPIRCQLTELCLLLICFYLRTTFLDFKNVELTNIYSK